MSSFKKSLQHDLDLIVDYQSSSPMLLPRSQTDGFIWNIQISFLFITAVSIGLFVLLTVAFPEVKKNDNLKATHRFTNLFVNFFLGIFGFYHFVVSLPSESTVVDRIQGFAHPPLIYFPIVQIGYNLWSLPFGFLVGEEGSMRIHHISVLIVASISTFCNSGFRYYGAFFFGIIEISSVPLSLMNYFKDSQSLIHTYPTAYLFIRLAFMISFLTARVIFWTPQMYDVIRCSTLLTSTCQTSICTITAGSFTLCAILLTLLQYLWATKILSGLIRLLSKKSTKKKEH